MPPRQIEITGPPGDTVSVLGIQVDAFKSYDQAIQFSRGKIETRTKTFCVAMNPEKMYRATRDGKLKAVLDQANLRICDGIGVALASWLLHGRMLFRCTGVDLFLRLIEAAAAKGWRVFFLGASPDSNFDAVENLLRSYPALQIAGCRDGYFDDSREVVQLINDSGADLLFVSMGSPRQEYWISEHLHHVTAPFCMGVGGSFDIVSGTAQRAPLAFRKTGTEWLFRLIREPARIRRQVALPLFAWSVLLQRFRGK